MPPQAGPILDLGTLLTHLRLDATQFQRAMAQAEKKIATSAKKMEQIGKQLTLRLTLPLLAFGGIATKAFADFDDAMTKSLAIMNNVTPMLRSEMEELAVTMSTQTVTSARDLAKSYFFLASAGFDAQQSMASLNAVNQFAIAGTFDMATATDLATDAQSALGLTTKDAQKNLEGMTRVTDVLVGANTLANATVEQFATSLTTQAGPAMKSFGVELEDGVAVLAAFADQGIKGQVAGSSLSRILLLMTRGFRDHNAAWKQFGVNIFDVNEELKPLGVIIGDISRVLEPMSTKQRGAALEMLGFQARIQQAILPLIGLGDRITEYNKKLLEMGGITERVARKNMASFSAEMAILKNRFVAAGISIGEILAPRIADLSKIVDKSLKSWNSLSDNTKNLVIDLGTIAALAGPAAFAIGKLTTAVIALNAALVSTVTTTGLFLAGLTAIASFKFGTFLFNEFEAVRKKAFDVAFQILEDWERVKFGFKQAVAAMRVVWDEFITAISRGLANLLDAFPGDEFDEQIKKLRVLKSVGMDMMAQNRKDLEAQLKLLAETRKALEEEILLEKLLATQIPDVLPPGTQTADEFKETAKAVKEVEDALVELGTPLQEWANAAKDVAKNVEEAFASAFDRLGDELAEFLIESKANFNDFAKSILKDLLAIAIRAQIIVPLAQGLGFIPTTQAHSGGTSGQMSSSFFGHGKLAANERAVVTKVGEQIVPAGESGMGTPPSVVINNNTGQAMKQQGPATFDGKKWIIGIVAENIEQGGVLRRAIQRGF